MLLVALILIEHESISKGMVYMSGFGFFFIAMDILINGLPEISTFLVTTIGIVLWGFGAYLILVPTLKDISEV